MGVLLPAMPMPATEEEEVPVVIPAVAVEGDRGIVGATVVMPDMGGVTAPTDEPDREDFSPEAESGKAGETDVDPMLPATDDAGLG